MVAILLYTSQVQVLTDFTADRDVLNSIIKGLPIGEMSDLAGLADTGDDNNEDTGAAFVADETEFNIFNTDQKLAAIEQAARMLSPLPEKKALIYFSAGVNKTGIDNQAQLEATINAAVKANVAIYPIDARGLMADPPGGDASKAASRGTGIFNGSVYNPQRATINDSQETLVHAGRRHRRQGVSSTATISRRHHAGPGGDAQLLSSSATTPPIRRRTASTAASPSS